MNFELYLTFILASVALILIPGPNVALIVAISVKQGIKSGLMTVLGTNLAQLIMLSITVFGVGAFMVYVAEGFEIIRWLGVLYLVYLGIKTFFENDKTEKMDFISGKRLFFQGFFVSLTNPKTLLFFAAFFPQFLDPSLDVSFQLQVMTFSFIVIAFVLDSLWAILSAKASKLLAQKGFAKIKNKIAGSLLLGAATGLALVRKN